MDSESSTLTNSRRDRQRRAFKLHAYMYVSVKVMVDVRVYLNICQYNGSVYVCMFVSVRMCKVCNIHYIDIKVCGHPFK